jgi:hypothetical protein
MRKGTKVPKKLSSAKELLDACDLQDPDMVGATEYRAIYEALSDGIDSVLTERDAGELIDPAAHAIAMLDEFIAHALGMKRSIQPKVGTFATD